MRFFVGVDLGQAQDPTAIAILERRTEAPLSEFHCRHLERLRLGTSYPAIADHVRELLEAPALKGQTELVVDATGVGRPVVDMLRQRELDPTAITITGGDAVTYDAGWRVPKRDLVGSVQVLLQTDRLKIAAELPDQPMLIRELLAFRVKIDPLTAHDSYGARVREGAHDDLVLAVAIAAWYGQRWQPTFEYPSSYSYESSSWSG